MPRRVSLPGASELFRATHQPDSSDDPADPPGPPADLDDQLAPTPGSATLSAVGSSRAIAISDPKPSGGSGRVRHDEKITVYVSSEELLALERARLELRAQHGLAVDRGRIVRQAIAATLADLETEGARSQLVRRLS